MLHMHWNWHLREVVICARWALYSERCCTVLCYAVFSFPLFKFIYSDHWIETVFGFLFSITFACHDRFVSAQKPFSFKINRYQLWLILIPISFFDHLHFISLENRIDSNCFATCEWPIKTVHRFFSMCLFELVSVCFFFGFISWSSFQCCAKYITGIERHSVCRCAKCTLHFTKRQKSTKNINNESDELNWSEPNNLISIILWS